MDDLGPAIAWPAVEEGTPVYDRDGNRIGVAEQVVGERDIFEGVLIHTHPLPGKHLFADAEQIAGLHERGVVLSVDKDSLRPPPPENPEQRRGDREHSPEEPRVEAGLRRLW